MNLFDHLYASNDAARQAIAKPLAQHIGSTLDQHWIKWFWMKKWMMCGVCGVLFGSKELYGIVVCARPRWSEVQAARAKDAERLCREGAALRSLRGWEVIGRVTWPSDDVTTWPRGTCYKWCSWIVLIALWTAQCCDVMLCHAVPSAFRTISETASQCSASSLRFQLFRGGSALYCGVKRTRLDFRVDPRSRCVCGILKAFWCILWHFVTFWCILFFLSSPLYGEPEIADRDGIDSAALQLKLKSMAWLLLTERNESYSSFWTSWETSFQLVNGQFQM